MKSLDVPQQMFLQSLIASRVMSEGHAKALHKAAITHCSMTYKASDYDDFFTKVAKAVQIVGLEIRRTIDETKGTHVVGIVNTKGDEIAQLATTLTPHEMTYVNKIIENIVRAPYESFCIGSKAALEIGMELSPQIQSTKAEAVCDKLVRNGWLRLSKAGRYSLTPRTLMELQNYLQNTYEDEIPLCTACEELLTNGFACSNIDCDVRVHRHCLLKWERSLKGNGETSKVCSRCDSAWETAPVGEPVISSQYGSVRQARAAKARVQAGEEEGEEEYGDEGEEMDGEEPEEDVDVQEQPQRAVISNNRRSNGNDESSRRRTRLKVEAEEDDELTDEEVTRPTRGRGVRSRR